MLCKQTDSLFISPRYIFCVSRIVIHIHVNRIHINPILSYSWFQACIYEQHILHLSKFRNMSPSPNTKFCHTPIKFYKLHNCTRYQTCHKLCFSNYIFTIIQKNANMQYFDVLYIYIYACVCRLGTKGIGHWLKLLMAKPCFKFPHEHSSSFDIFASAGGSAATFIIISILHWSYLTNLTWLQCLQTTLSQFA